MRLPITQTKISQLPPAKHTQYKNAAPKLLGSIFILRIYDLNTSHNGITDLLPGAVYLLYLYVPMANLYLCGQNVHRQLSVHKSDGANPIS